MTVVVGTHSRAMVRPKRKEIEAPAIPPTDTCMVIISIWSGANGERGKGGRQAVVGCAVVMGGVTDKKPTKTPKQNPAARFRT